MPTAILLNLGFDATVLLSLIPQLSSGDRLILVLPKVVVERLMSTVEDVKKTIRSLSVKGVKVSVDTLQVDDEDIGLALDQLTEVVDELKREGYEVHVDAGSGVRSIVVALTLLYQLSQGAVGRGFTRTERTGMRVELPKPIPCRVRWRDMLEKMFEVEEATVDLVASSLRKDDSTVRRGLKELRELGLLNYRRKGQKGIYKITPLGRAMCRIMRWRGF